MDNNDNDTAKGRRIEERARDLARRVMSTRPEPQSWPKKANQTRSHASKPEKPEPTGEAS
jgi:hypothetical protein